jgi:regulator of sigma E protease
MRRLIEKSSGKKLDVVVLRDGQNVTLQVVPKLSKDKGPFGERVGRIGVAPSGKGLELGVFQSLREGWRSSMHMTGLVLKTLVKVVQREVSAKELAGPLTIAQFSGESLKHGISSFVFVLSFISINLAIINLLPIPILDGGHLFFFFIEAIMRRPVTGKVREVATHAGLLFIIFLMVFVIYNDISRIMTKKTPGEAQGQAVEQPAKTK